MIGPFAPVCCSCRLRRVAWLIEPDYGFPAGAGDGRTRPTGATGSDLPGCKQGAFHGQALRKKIAMATTVDERGSASSAGVVATRSSSCRFYYPIFASVGV